MIYHAYSGKTRLIIVFCRADTHLVISKNINIYLALAYNGSMTLSYLYILSGALKGYKLRLEPGFTLGRSTAHYNLKDPKSSEIHCVVAEQEGKLFLLDNESKNGIWVDGQKVEKIEVRHKQRIQIGSTRMEMRLKKSSSQKEKAIKQLGKKKGATKISSYYRCFP